MKPIARTLKAVARWIGRLDVLWGDRMANAPSPAVRSGLEQLSNAANHSKLWIGVAAAMASLGDRRGRRAALRGLMSVAGASAVTNAVLKPLLPRHRPPLLATPIPSIVRRPASSSFPSGHSASAAAFATATAMEAPALAAPVAALAAGVAYSRISTRVHYPSDVIVGSAVGAAVALATTKVWPRIDPTPAKASAPIQRRATREPSSTGKGLVIVVNASSGPSSHDKLLDEVSEALPDTTIVKVEDPEELVATFDQIGEDAIAIGVVGGDGTIGAAATAAIDKGKPLVIFPGGTLNHFARDLGVDSVASALDAFRDGHLVEVDVGVVDDRVFLNTASFGTYSDFVNNREKYENSIGKWPAVAIALAQTMINSEPACVTIDGRPRKIWMAFIGNCEYEPAGFAPAGRSRLDDGLLDVRIVDGTSPFARTRLLLAVLTGQLGRSVIYTRTLTEELKVNTGDFSADLAADGETFSGSGEFVIAKHPQRLLTYAPHR